jgi:hypothetical protein
MKKLTESAVLVMMLLFISAFPGCETYRYGTQGPQIVVDNPQWAPPYYSGARYYYFPDIECYYDLYSREFIYLDHAQWIYSRDIPYMYRDFDLNNCFVVVVNSTIYQPWMHHQYYVSHFPRYYYRDYYDHSNIPYVRGYNENSRSAIYWGENERGRARSWDGENLRNNRQFKYSKDDRLQKNNTYKQGDYRQTPESGDRQGNREDNNRNRTNPRGNQVNKSVPGQQPAATPETERNHNTNYYGKPIGQPVKVERKMRNQPENESKEESKNPDTKRRSNSGRR